MSRDERASGHHRSIVSASGACSPISISTASSISSSPTVTSTRRCATSAATVGYAQPPLLFLNQGNAAFREAAGQAGNGFAQARVGRGLAAGDFDRDGDVDLLMTTNNGPAVLFRNDQKTGNRSLRLRLVGTQSNRDAIGATVASSTRGTSQSRMVRSGSSYLSQSELPVTFGVGKRGPRGPSSTDVAQWADRGIQGRRDRQGLRLRRGERYYSGMIIRSIAFIAAVLASAAVASAHHGFGTFDLSKSVTYTGKLTRLEFINPHSWLYFETTDNGKVTKHRCEMRSAHTLRRSGGRKSCSRSVRR
jgi:hypothetical protein